MKGRNPTPCTMPRTEISRRSRVGVLCIDLLKLILRARAPWAGAHDGTSTHYFEFYIDLRSHLLDLHIPLDPWPGHVRYVRNSSRYQTKEQQFLHTDFTSFSTS